MESLLVGRSCRRQKPHVLTESAGLNVHYEMKCQKAFVHASKKPRWISNVEVREPVVCDTKGIGSLD